MYRNADETISATQVKHCEEQLTILQKPNGFSYLAAYVINRPHDLFRVIDALTIGQLLKLAEIVDDLPCIHSLRPNM